MMTISPGHQSNNNFPHHGTDDEEDEASIPPTA